MQAGVDMLMAFVHAFWAASVEDIKVRTVVPLIVAAVWVLAVLAAESIRLGWAILQVE
jgi:hypothetical protein